MQYADWTYVRYERNGETEYWYVESFDPDTLTYKIRNARGHILTKKYSETFEQEEIPDIQEPEPEETYFEKFRRYATLKNALNAGFTLIATWLVLWGISQYQPEQTTRQQEITEQINALNQKNVPLIWSCVQMRENDKEIRMLISELRKLKWE